MTTIPEVKMNRYTSCVFITAQAALFITQSYWEVHQEHEQCMHIDAEDTEGDIEGDNLQELNKSNYLIIQPNNAY